MALQNVYTEVNFKNQPVSSGIISDSSSAPLKKTTIHKSNHGFPTLILASLMTFFLLVAILLSVALIILFQMYSELLEEKNTIKQLNHTQLDCIKNHSSVEDKAWSCCPKDWKPFSSHCYFTPPGSASWNVSEETCSSMGAHLLVIHSKEQQYFITKILNMHAAYYVGLSDPGGHSQWQWVDQTPYNENATFWHSDEHSGDEECCVVLNYHPSIKEWGWSDVPCDGVHRSVCEMTQLYL